MSALRPGIRLVSYCSDGTVASTGWADGCWETRWHSPGWAGLEHKMRHESAGDAESFLRNAFKGDVQSVADYQETK